MATLEKQYKQYVHEHEITSLQPTDIFHASKALRDKYTTQILQNTTKDVSKKLWRYTIYNIISLYRKKLSTSNKTIAVQHRIKQRYSEFIGIASNMYLELSAAALKKPT